MIMFTLSEAAMEVLNAKSREYGVPLDRVLESMVLEFRASTPQDLTEQQDLRISRFLTVYPKDRDMPLHHAWRRGYNAAWYDYQLRHKDTFIAAMRRLGDRAPDIGIVVCNTCGYHFKYPDTGAFVSTEGLGNDGEYVCSLCLKEHE